MNSRKTLPFLWVFFIFLLQSAAGSVFPQKTPSILLVAVLFYALSEGPHFGFWLGAYTGALLEIFGAGRMGGEIFVFALAGFVFGHAARTFFREGFFSRFLLPLAAFYLTTVLRFAILYFSLKEPVNFSLLWQSLTFWDTAWVLAASPVIFFFLKRMSYRRERR